LLVLPDLANAMKINPNLKVQGTSTPGLPVGRSGLESKLRLCDSRMTPLKSMERSASSWLINTAARGVP
jgi:hypothetical protein